APEIVQLEAGCITTRWRAGSSRACAGRSPSTLFRAPIPGQLAPWIYKGFKKFFEAFLVQLQSEVPGRKLRLISGEQPLMFLSFFGQLGSQVGILAGRRLLNLIFKKPNLNSKQLPLPLPVQQLFLQNGFAIFQLLDESVDNRLRFLSLLVRGVEELV